MCDLEPFSKIQSFTRIAKIKNLPLFMQKCEINPLLLLACLLFVAIEY